MSSLVRRAHAAHREGRLADAERDYRAALANQPAHVDALHWLGVLHHQRGEHGAAADLLNRATLLRPSDAGMQLNLGAVLKALGRLDGAIEHFRNAIHLRSDFALAHYNLGNAYAAAGRHEDAVDSFQRSLRLQADDVRALVNLGTSLLALGRHADAAAATRDALRVAPRHAGACNNLGMALNGLGAPQDAVAQFHAALDAQPNFVAAHFNLANTLNALGCHADAIDAYQRALALQPTFVAAWHGLGTTHAELGQHARAAACFERAVGLDPRFALAWLALGNAQSALVAHDAALRAYDQALRLRPDLASAHLHRAMTMLARGDFARGLPEYEWRHATLAPLRPFDAPRWSGPIDGPIAGRTVLVHAEQGLGDTLHFVRYVPRLIHDGARVVLEVQPTLGPLLEPFCEAHRIELVTRGEPGAARPAHDWHLPLLSLPLALSLDAEALTDDLLVPYLAAPAAYRRKWRGSLGGQAKVKIGIAWSGNIQRQDTRALPFAALMPLFALPGIDWIVLQRDWLDADRAVFDAQRPPSVCCVDAHLGDFADTAAIVERLDAVVSIDTSLAHLAGALGKRLWLMLPFAADWRWFGSTEATRNTSPWYPSARLVRQRQAGDWDDVVARVREAVRVIAADG